MRSNPYTLLFGKEPDQIVSRTAEIMKIEDSFTAENPTQQIYMIAGVRGCGKTVLLSEVSNRIRKAENWIVIELNPERDLLSDLAGKLNSDRMLAELFQRAKLNLSFFGIGLDISGVPPVTNIETALEKMLEQIKKNGKRVLITVDEVVSNPSVKEFSHSFQLFIRNDYPVFLLMTGLYENINNLQNEKSLTFLYRAPKIELKPLSLRAITEHYRNSFSIDRDSAGVMAQMTCGYSFAFQVLGYLTWENQGDYLSVKREYMDYLADYSYDKIWGELSETDKRVAYAVASSENGRILEIREALKMDTNHFNPYRKRLIRKGLLNGDQYGYVRFVLPYFKEYVLSQLAA